MEGIVFWNVPFYVCVRIPTVLAARFSHSLTYLKSCTQFCLYVRFSLLVIGESALLTNWQSAMAEVDYRFP